MITSDLSRTHRMLLAGLLLGALLLRLGWGLSRAADDASVLRSLPDQREYLTLGRNLLAGRGLVFHDDRYDVDVYAFRTPGYPLFVAGCGGNVRIIRAVQALLDTSTVLAMFLLARRWLSPRSSLLAGAFVAINPFLIYFSGLILSETLFIALLAWGMTLVVRRCANQTSEVEDRLHGRDARVTGDSVVTRAPRPCKRCHGFRAVFNANTLVQLTGLLLLALAALVRPSALLLPALIGIAAAFVNRPASGSYQLGRRAILNACAGIALTVIVLLPWAWRNHRVLGEWVWTASNDGFTLYDGFNPSATGASDQSVLKPFESQLRSMPDELQRSRYLTKLAKAYIRRHPDRVLELCLAKTLRTWSPYPLSSEYGGNWKLVTISLLYSVPLFVLTLTGLWLTRLSKAAKVFLMAPAIYFTIAHAASVGSLRYRLPADVPMAIVAVAGRQKAVGSRQKAEGRGETDD